MICARTLLLVLATLAAAGCASTTTQTTDAGRREDATIADDAAVEDAASDEDASADDASADDAAMSDDAFTRADTGPRPDAGMCADLPPDPTRPVAIQCSDCRPPGPGTGGGRGDCATDADCTAGDNGRCVFGRIGGYCDYDLCFVDADCNAGEVCLCDGSMGGGNTCVSGDCRVDADCNDGFACAPTFGSCGHYLGFVAYRCHRAADVCDVDADCPGGYCAFDEVVGHWVCSSSECAG